MTQIQLLYQTDSLLIVHSMHINLRLISRSAAGLQDNAWLLKINIKKTKTLIFQKQNRKSTHDKFSFFLNGIPIDKALQYSYLGITFNNEMEFC